MSFPVITCYKELVAFNKSLIASNKNLPELNLEGADFNKNSIKVNGEVHFVDEFLYNYVVNHTGILTGKVAGLSRYDYTRLNYLLHPETKEEFISSLREYINNILLMGDEGVVLWDFIVTLSNNGIVLSKCNKPKALGIFIPNFITRIGAHAFEEQDIEKVIIEQHSQLKSIGDYAFTSCGKLNTIKLPEGLEAIGKYAFGYCKIKSLSIPNSVTSIGDNAFTSCEKLNTIKLPEGLETIGKYAFSHCRFKEIVIPNSVTSIEHAAFYSGSLERVSFKNNSRLKHIGDYAFAVCTALKEINLPSSLISIDDSALIHTALKEIEIPDSVTKLGKGVFEYCTGLERAIVGRGVSELPALTFRKCEALKEITILGNPSIIGSKAFGGSALTEILIPSSVKEIQDNAFMGCQELRRVRFQDNSSLELIGESAFSVCTVLEEINLPSSLVKIDAQVFHACDGLKKIEIPDSVEKMGMKIFEYCCNLESVRIGKGVKEIPLGTFDGCTSLRKIVLLGNIEKISPYAFEYDSKEARGVSLKVYMPKTSKFETNEIDERVEIIKR